MIRKLFAATIVLFLMLSGCVDKPEITIHRYDCEVDSGILFISSDGTYESIVINSHVSGFYGNYTIRNDIVLLKTFGLVRTFKMDGDDLIDQDGDRWVLQR